MTGAGYEYLFVYHDKDNSPMHYVRADWDEAKVRAEFEALSAFWDVVKVVRRPVPAFSDVMFEKN